MYIYTHKRQTFSISSKGVILETNCSIVIFFPDDDDDDLLASFPPFSIAGVSSLFTSLQLFYFKLFRSVQFSLPLPPLIYNLGLIYNVFVDDYIPSLYDELLSEFREKMLKIIYFKLKLSKLMMIIFNSYFLTKCVLKMGIKNI